MPLPSFVRLVAGTTLRKAEQVNWLYDEIEKIAPGVLLADYTNVETIGATRALLDSDLPIQRLTPSGADWAVTFPAPGAGNHPFFIINDSGTYNLTLPAGYPAVEPGGNALILSDGVAWHVASKTSREPGYLSEKGALPAYVGAAAYNIGAGAAVVNGQLLVWASAISRSGLSLTANTLYYIYLYNNAGTPAIEESTTVPVWDSALDCWKKTGDGTRRCVGWITTNGSAAIRQFVATLFGRKLQVFYADGNNANRVVFSATTDSSWVSVSLAPLVPVNAYEWFCSSKIDYPAAGDAVFAISPIDLGASNASEGVFSIRLAMTGAGRQFTGRQWLPITVSQINYFRMLHLGGSGNLGISEAWGASIVR